MQTNKQTNKPTRKQSSKRNQVIDLLNLSEIRHYRSLFSIDMHNSNEYRYSPPITPVVQAYVRRRRRSRNSFNEIAFIVIKFRCFFNFDD